jgi:spore maturation protein CgeB
MLIAIFGLSISSSWGNGHATLWRGLCAALARRNHRVVFFERDVPYYAMNRDLWEIPGGELVLYRDWAEVAPLAERHLAVADVAMVTSYCPDGVDAAELVLSSPAGMRLFYDLDTPITLANLTAGKSVSYIGSHGLAGFDLVLSYTGGAALDALKSRLGARRVAPLYGSVDPSVHRRVAVQQHYSADLSYLGTYAADRQTALRELLIEPAQHRPGQRFLIGGAQYPAEFPWLGNIFFVRHLPPSEHPAFYSSSRLTLNITRAAMARTGWCPSGRLFEAAACGVPILSDSWPGLEEFFTPGSEILVAESREDAIAALDLSGGELARIARAARERTEAEHTADQRVREFERLLDARAASATTLDIHSTGA